MDIKVYLYVFFTFMAIFILNGVDINRIMKQNRLLESRLLVLALSFGISYLLTNFVIDFVS